MVCGAVLQPPFLLAGRSKVIGAEPGFISGFQRWPITVKDREPGCIPIAALADNRLREKAIILKAEARRGSAGRRVQAVAFPFIAAVSKLFKDPAH